MRHSITHCLLTPLVCSLKYDQDNGELALVDSGEESECSGLQWPTCAQDHARMVVLCTQYSYAVKHLAVSPCCGTAIGVQVQRTARVHVVSATAWLQLFDCHATIDCWVTDACLVSCCLHSDSRTVFASNASSNFLTQHPVSGWHPLSSMKL